MEESLESTDGVYVALDCDVFEEREITSFMPEPGGLILAQVEELFSVLQERTTVVGMGLSGLAPHEENVSPLTKLCGVLGF